MRRRRPMPRRKKDKLTVGLDVTVGGNSEDLAETIALVLKEFGYDPRLRWEKAIDLGVGIETFLSVTILELLIEEHGEGLSDALRRAHARSLCAVRDARLKTSLRAQPVEERMTTLAETHQPNGESDGP